MAEPLLRVESISRRFGGLLAVNNASLEVAPGSITALIGPNGAGKTTLFSMIAGFVTPSSGHIHFDGAEITGIAPHHLAHQGIARTFQIIQPFKGLTVLDNIAVGAYLRNNNRRTVLAAAKAIADECSLSHMIDAQADSLTVSASKRLELARALATKPRLLLLDEVMAGLNPSEVRDILPLIRRIRDGGTTILMTEHVMQAVMNLSEQVYVLAEGQIIASGKPQEIVANERVIEAYLGRGAAQRYGRTEATL